MMAWGDFHFLRPWWLLALLPGAWLLLRGRLRRHSQNPWAQAVDAELLRVLSGGPQIRRRTPEVLVALAGLVAVLALAGPAWQRLPQPELKTREARVILLDLSQSMDARDLAPSRLIQARAAARKLIEALPGGRVGLVAFAGSAHTVVPLTDDRRTVVHLLAMLATDLMPVPGSRIANGIESGTALLRGGEALQGDLILITDSPADDAARVAASAAAAAGHRLWIIGVGTPGGAPVPLAKGGLLKDRSGKLAMPGLDEESLKALAAFGGGAYERLSEGGPVLERYSWKPGQLGTAALATKFRTDAWHDEGRWLVVALLPLAALAFRRGNLAVLCLAACLLPSIGHAQGLASLEWWRSDNERGRQLLAQGQATAAARAFGDAQWRGVAAYRAGAYHAAAAFFAEDDSALAHYNRGNALAKAGRLYEAVAAYEQALEQAPEMDDARFNRELVQRLLPQPPPALAMAGGVQLDTAQGAAGAGKSRGDSARGRSSSGAAGTGSSQGRAPQRTGEKAGNSGQSDARSAEAGAEPGATARTAARGSEPAPGGKRAKAMASTNPGSDSASQDTASASGLDGRSKSGGREDETRGEDLEPWLRQIEDDPGGLLRRKFQRLPSQGAAVPADPPW